MPALAAEHAKTVKVAVDLPAPLFRATEQAMQELSMNRSRLIRTALEMFLFRREQEKLECAIADSFRANRDFDRQLVDEFKYVDAEADANFDAKV